MFGGILDESANIINEHDYTGGLWTFPKDLLGVLEVGWIYEDRGGVM